MLPARKFYVALISNGGQTIGHAYSGEPKKFDFRVQTH
jgi:hypothetical protein